MADKRKLSTILGICGATVLASGGSVFVTNTALSLVDGEKQVTEAVKPELGNQETEAPLSIEQFAKTEDSFTILAKKDKEETEKETASAEDGEKDATGSGTDGSNTGASDGSTGSADSGSAGNGTSGESSGGRTSGNTTSGNSNDSTGVSYDEWGGWYNADGDYYDGKGGYFDGDGYHYVGTPDTFTDGSIPNTSVGGSSSGGNTSSGGGSSSGGSSWDDGVDIIDPGTGGGSGAWDDSYKCYEINSRYLAREELSSWGSEDLAQLRNEIFARHGRIFTTQKWIDYFATKTWYTPTYDAAYFDANMGSFLNDYEWKNLDLILELENEIGY